MHGLLGYQISDTQCLKETTACVKALLYYQVYDDVLCIALDGYSMIPVSILAKGTLV